MKKQYGFYINSSFCSGCKTCQVACKDKNNLEKGRKFRHVYEISGGDWEQKGETWVHHVFTYNLSISCNHCSNPECVKACPTKAHYKRKDGIVIIDPDKCIGCRYCAWACPYGAPQFNPELGIITKCDLCLDYLKKGKNPACVDACPMRAIEVEEIGELKKKYKGKNAIFPLPPFHITRPSLIVNPHKDARDVDDQKAEIVNREEI